MKNPESNWWWRRVQSLPQDDSCRQWFTDNEMTAFKYELARRHFPAGKYPSFVELPRLAFDELRMHLFHPCSPITVCSDSAMAPPHDGYARLPHEWNLRASDARLVEAFLQSIHDERLRHRIKTPPRNQGNRNRGVSWRWPELMDTRKGLNDSERSHLAQARRAAAKLKPQFLKAWKGIQQRDRIARDMMKDGKDCGWMLAPAEWWK